MFNHLLSSYAFSSPLHTLNMASSNSFGNVPAGASQKPTPFELHIGEQQLQDFETLLRLSPIAKTTYENLRKDGEFGVTHEWMSDAKSYWQQNFDWYG